VFLTTSVRVSVRVPARICSEQFNANTSNSITTEKHFTPSELAEAWNLSVETIRNLFRDEPDVLKIANASSRQKRGYTSLRIPKQVVERVHRRL
jgi:hypothetical protein